MPVVHKAGTLALVPAGQAREGELAVSDHGPFRVAVIAAELRGTPRRVTSFVAHGVDPHGRAATAAAVCVDCRRPPRRVERSRRVQTEHARPRNGNSRWGKGPTRCDLIRISRCRRRSSRRSIEFRGAFGVEMAAGPQEIVFGDLASGRRETRRAGSVTVGLRGVEFPRPGEGQGTARIEISLVYDQGGPAFESYRTWMYHNEAALETKSGRRIAPRPIITTRQQGDGSFAIEYNFAQVPGQFRAIIRFVYLVPSLICELPVEFRFNKITVLPAASPRRGNTMNVSRSSEGLKLHNFYARLHLPRLSCRFEGFRLAGPRSPKYESHCLAARST